MKNEKEIVLNFPLKKKAKYYKKEGSITSNSDKNEKLNRFLKLSEKLRNDEWHQEYFLIYNSYTLDNR